MTFTEEENIAISAFYEGIITRSVSENNKPVV